MRLHEEVPPIPWRRVLRWTGVLALLACAYLLMTWATWNWGLGHAEEAFAKHQPRGPSQPLPDPVAERSAVAPGVFLYRWSTPDGGPSGESTIIWVPGLECWVHEEEYGIVCSFY